MNFKMLKLAIGGNTDWNAEWEKSWGWHKCSLSWLC